MPLTRTRAREQMIDRQLARAIGHDREGHGYPWKVIRLPAIRNGQLNNRRHDHIPSAAKRVPRPSTSMMGTQISTTGTGGLALGRPLCNKRYSSDQQQNGTVTKANSTTQ